MLQFYILLITAVFLSLFLHFFELATFMLHLSLHLANLPLKLRLVHRCLASATLSNILLDFPNLMPQLLCALFHLLKMLRQNNSPLFLTCQLLPNLYNPVMLDNDPPLFDLDLLQQQLLFFFHFLVEQLEILQLTF
jgi:hypothetical protein